jgi:hypothetical protein
MLEDVAAIDEIKCFGSEREMFSVSPYRNTRVAQIQRYVSNARQSMKCLRKRRFRRKMEHPLNRAGWQYALPDVQPAGSVTLE